MALKYSVLPVSFGKVWEKLDELPSRFGEKADSTYLYSVQNRIGLFTKNNFMKKQQLHFTTLFLLFFSFTYAQAQTFVVDSFVSGGLMRTFRVYVPTIYSNTNAVPLILNLHGYTSNAIEQEFYGNFKPIADTANIILVHPNGTLDQNGDQYWNNFDGSSVDDVGFLSALIDTISNRYNIDQNRIYSTGMSNGGFMSYDLACFLSHRIAAIASVTGAMIFTHMANCNPSHPMPVMQVHGTADQTVPYAGTVAFSPIEDLVDFWVNFNNCDTTPVFTALPDISTTDGCTAEHFVYTGGTYGSTVEFYKVLGGAHTWPGAIFNIGVTNQDFDASKEIWRFFSQYRLDDLVSINQVESSNSALVYPNPASQSIFVSATNNGFTISDMLGKTWFKFAGKTNPQWLDISSLPAGVYLFSRDAAVQRFVVEGR
jgi:polyhydroxybutyrate depolymerase